MKMTALELKSLQVVDKIVREREFLTEETSEEVIKMLRRGLNLLFYGM